MINIFRDQFFTIECGDKKRAFGQRQAEALLAILGTAINSFPPDHRATRELQEIRTKLLEIFIEEGSPEFKMP